MSLGYGDNLFKINHQKGVIDPYDIVQRFDLSICQVAMIVDPETGEKIFIYGDYVEKALSKDRIYVDVHYVNSLRLPDRVQKYKERGFYFWNDWEEEWDEWFQTQPESKDDSSYWDDESDDDEDRVRTHPLLDRARARWAREDAAPKPQRRAVGVRKALRKSLEGL